MFKKLVLFGFVPLLALSQPAEARRLFWWQMVNPDGTAVSPDVYNDAQAPQDYYGSPDPYASEQDQFNQYQYDQYRRELARRYHHRAYYQDAPPDYYGGPDYGPPPPYAAPVYPVKPVKPVTKKLAQQKPVKKAKAKPPVMPSGPITKSASSTTAPVMPSGPITASGNAPSVTTATASPAKTSTGGPVSCDKGASIVSSFGFSNVTSKSCTGATLVYGAERSGKPFEINVNAASGELTAVKKL